MYGSADEVMQAEALFVSPLQASDTIDPDTVIDTVDTLLRRHGPAGCAAQMAYEFGDHPDTAVRRMRWARRVVRQIVAPSTATDA